MAERAPTHDQNAYPPPEDKALAAQLNRLFLTIRAPGSERYSNDEVASRLESRGGPTISGTYLWQLRTGRRDNPTKRHLEAIAAFFGVPASYFFDDEVAAQLNVELTTIRKLCSAGVQNIALRAVGLSPRSLDRLSDLVDYAREMEGLPSEPDPDER
ncbi:XRE family transcriptional regulator [Streptomyces sp. NPDC014734]|uniref:XRE family transcriptional regulator n=1 Tax=Streptomyces sp. NPDC014734 TaxID=3364886 RepID=UPI0036FCEC5F